MKLKTNIYGIEIEIKAKGLYNDNRYNKEDTGAFLNEIAIIANKAAVLDEMNGVNPTKAKQLHDIIFNELRDQGYYKR